MLSVRLGLDFFFKILVIQPSGSYSGLDSSPSNNFYLFIFAKYPSSNWMN